MPKSWRTLQIHSADIAYTDSTSQQQVCQAATHAGYIIGRGVRIVEWNVAEHPDGPDGDLASMKLRALTPDGIRMAIAKEYGLSNYREVAALDTSTLLACILYGWL